MAHWSVPLYHALFLFFYFSISFPLFFFLFGSEYLPVHWTIPPWLYFVLWSSLPVHWIVPLCLNVTLVSTLLSHWTVPPFLFLSVCLCLYYITTFIIVNTFFQKTFNFFISFCFSVLFVNFQKILTFYQSFSCSVSVADKKAAAVKHRSSPLLSLFSFPSVRS